MIEERWKEKVMGTILESLAEQLLFSGAASRTNICMCPDLQSWVAAELQKESAMLKERRKAHEERALVKPKGVSG